MEANTDCPGPSRPLAVHLFPSLLRGSPLGALPPSPHKPFKKRFDRKTPASALSCRSGGTSPLHAREGSAGVSRQRAGPYKPRKPFSRRRACTSVPRAKSPALALATCACGSGSRTWAALPPGFCRCPPPRSPRGARPHAPGCPSPGSPAGQGPAAARRRR